MLGVSCSKRASVEGVVRTGPEIYKASGCKTCHGDMGQGNRTGPSLLELDKHFDGKSLTAFLLDPAASIAGNSRLEALDNEYRSTMKPVTYLNAEELEVFSKWLLALPQAAQ